MGTSERQILDYDSARAALDRFVGRRVSTRVASKTGATVAGFAVGYLQTRRTVRRAFTSLKR